MTGETLLVVGITIGINAVGWIGSIWKNNSRNSKEAGIIEERLKNIDEKIGANKKTIEKIPCVHDPEYFARSGEMKAQVNNHEGRLNRIETKMNGKN